MEWCRGKKKNERQAKDGGKLLSTAVKFPERRGGGRNQEEDLSARRYSTIKKEFAAEKYAKPSLKETPRYELEKRKVYQQDQNAATSSTNFVSGDEEGETDQEPEKGKKEEDKKGG